MQKSEFSGDDITKLCFIANVDSSLPAGAESHFWGIMESLPSHFQEFHLVVPETEISFNAAQTHTVRTNRKGKLGHLMLAFLLIKKSKEICKRGGIKTIYTRSMANALLFHPKKNGPRLILEVNGIWSDEARIRGDRKIVQKAIKMGEKRIIKKASRIITVTDEIKSYYIKQGHDPDKFFTIENGTAHDIFVPMPPNQKTRKEYGIKEREKVVLFVGKFHKWQGVDILIRSVPLVLEKIPTTKFLLVGDGPELEETKKMAEELKINKQLIFAGRVPWKDIPQIINISDVCTAIRRPVSGSPLKLYEYLSCGKPVIATNIPSFKEIEEHDCGILVPTENPQEAADGIVTLLSDAEKAKEMGTNGRRMILENHTWEIVATEIASVCTKTKPTLRKN